MIVVRYAEIDGIIAQIGLRFPRAFRVRQVMPSDEVFVEAATCTMRDDALRCHVGNVRGVDLLLVVEPDVIMLQSGGNQVVIGW